MNVALEPSSLFAASSEDVSEPRLPSLNLAVSPGHNLWVDEDLILECRLYNVPSSSATAVWYRALLDPAGRRLRMRHGGNDLTTEAPAQLVKRGGQGARRRHRPLVVRERTAELLSHGEMLLLSDDRFTLEVTRYEDCVVYRLEV